MPYKLKVPIWAVMGGIAVAATAFAQQALTVGDILAKGGKKLGKQEVQALYSDATVSGIQSTTLPNITFKNLYSANGNVVGDAWNKGTWFTKISGRWSVNDAGQLCSDLNNSAGDKIQACGHYYLYDGHYYAGGTGDPATKVVERKFERP